MFLVIYENNINIQRTILHIVKYFFRDDYLLAQLIDDPPENAARILVVCGFDLFIPILTFVFGEAQLEGIGAVVSTYRLRSEF